MRLAEGYGGADSARFVNGVLDAVKRTLEEPVRQPVPGDPKSDA